MHLQQVLIDREELGDFDILRDFLVSSELVDRELLLWVLVLLHEESILNVLVGLVSLT